MARRRNILQETAKAGVNALFGDPEQQRAQQELQMQQRLADAQIQDELLSAQKARADILDTQREMQAENQLQGAFADQLNQQDTVRPTFDASGQMSGAQQTPEIGFATGLTGTRGAEEVGISPSVFNLGTSQVQEDPAQQRRDQATLASLLTQTGNLDQLGSTNLALESQRQGMSGTEQDTGELLRQGFGAGEIKGLDFIRSQDRLRLPEEEREGLAGAVSPTDVRGGALNRQNIAGEVTDDALAQQELQGDVIEAFDREAGRTRFVPEDEAVRNPEQFGSVPDSASSLGALGETGGFEKQVNDFAAQVTATKNLNDFATRLQDRLRERGSQSLGIVGSSAETINAARAQAESVLRNDSDIAVDSDLVNESGNIDLGGFSSQVQDVASAKNLNDAIVEDMAFMIAASREEGGRFSKEDIERAIASIGRSADVDVFTEALDSLKERQRIRIRNKRDTLESRARDNPEVRRALQNIPSIQVPQGTNQRQSSAGNVQIMEDAQGNRARVRVNENGEPVEVIEELQ